MASCLVLWLMVAAAAWTQAAAPVPVGAQLDPSIQFESEASTRRAASFLVENQLADGSWGSHPAITSLAVVALANCPGTCDGVRLQAMERGADFIVDQARADGSIANVRTSQYPVYSTAVSVLALVRLGRPADEAVVRKARRFLLAHQRTALPEDDPSHGGFSRNGSGRADLVTTQWSLEALYMTDRFARPPLSPGPREGQLADLAYRAALGFIRRCQKLDVPVDTPEHGSFAYFAGPAGDANSPAMPCSAAFLTAAGLKSLIYAGEKPEGTAATAAFAWLCRNFTTSENPGLGGVGLYTYLYTLAKALGARERVSLTIGGSVAPTGNWRTRVLRTLLGKQRGDGAWTQSEPEWGESHPVLSTAYALLAMEMALGPGR